MSLIQFSEQNRFTLPRLGKFSNKMELNLMSGSVKQILRNVSPLRENIDREFEITYNWVSSPSVATALDLVRSTIMSDSDLHSKEARGAANFLIQNQYAPVLVKSMAKIVLNEVSSNDLGRSTDLALLYNRQVIHDEIHALRKLVHKYPNDSISWSNLAYTYARIHEREKAMFYASHSVFMSPNNRFVQRNAAKIFDHFDDAEAAIYHLVKSEYLKYDPWLISVIVSISNKYKLKQAYAGSATKLLKNTTLDYFDSSELYSAMAMFEFSQNSFKTARKYFRDSLISPTENSLAQAEWVSSQLFHLPIDENLLAVKGTFEAKSWNSFFLKDWDKALEQSRHWIMAFPTDVFAAIFGSYLGLTIFEDSALSEHFINIGKMSNPNNWALLNNEAMNLAGQGKIEEANTSILSIEYDHDDIRSAIIMATKGFIMYKSNKPSEGRLLYNSAIELLKKKGETNRVLHAKLNLAIEESRINPIIGSAMVDDLVQEINKSDRPELEVILNKAKKLIGNTSRMPT